MKAVFLVSQLACDSTTWDSRQSRVPSTSHLFKSYAF